MQGGHVGATISKHTPFLVWYLKLYYVVIATLPHNTPTPFEIPHPSTPTCMCVPAQFHPLHSTSRTLLTPYPLAHPHLLPFLHCLKQVVGILHRWPSGEGGTGLDVI